MLLKNKGAQRPAPDDDFAEIFRQHGATGTAKRLGLTVSAVNKRRQSIERRLGVKLAVGAPTLPPPAEYAHRVTLSVPNGIVLVASDAHYWPGDPNVMHRALVSFCKEYKPKALIFNGDVLDFAGISRHPPIGWEHQPSLIEEIEVAKDRLHELELTTPRGCQLIWTMGNHCARFETRLATVAPEYAQINGVHLHDHYPQWETAWACWVNEKVVIKHRFKGGIHAPHTNAMWAGKTIVTGHLHSAKVTPFTDYNGTRYGVDTGCLADTNAGAFTDYTEDNPKNWVSAFGMFTFKDGELLWPELVVKWDSKRIQFRGQLISV